MVKHWPSLQSEPGQHSFSSEWGSHTLTGSLGLRQTPGPSPKRKQEDGGFDSGQSLLDLHPGSGVNERVPAVPPLGLPPSPAFPALEPAPPPPPLVEEPSSACPEQPSHTPAIANAYLSKAGNSIRVTPQITSKLRAIDGTPPRAKRGRVCSCQQSSKRHSVDLVSTFDLSSETQPDAPTVSPRAPARDRPGGSRRSRRRAACAPAGSRHSRPA